LNTGIKDEDGAIVRRRLGLGLPLALAREELMTACLLWAASRPHDAHP
jgi:hypothetical protein